MKGGGFLAKDVIMPIGGRLVAKTPDTKNLHLQYYRMQKKL